MKENVYYSLRSGLIFDKYKSCYFEKVNYLESEINKSICETYNSYIEESPIDTYIKFKTEPKLFTKMIIDESVQNIIRKLIKMFYGGCNEKI